MRISRIVALTLTAQCVSAAVIGASQAALSITEERIAALPRARQAAWRDYLARSQRQMEADRAFLQKELSAAGLATDLIPPNGPAARSIPLNRPAEWYGSAEARRIADIVVSFQTPAGGWSKNLNMADHARRPGERFAPDNVSTHLGPGDFDTPHDPKWNYVGTLDNDATTTELQFLAKVIAAAPKDGATHRASFLRGLEYIFAAQFPDGGWPQVWPLEGGYHDAITFNDGAITETLALLQAVAEGQAGFAFVPPDIRARARASVAKGIECILAAQIVPQGRRTVWAQQHDALSLQPVAGRNYEPAAQSSSESATLVLFLMRLPDPSPAVVDAVHAAVAWLRKTAIYGKASQRGADGRRLVSVDGAGPIWSRFYEIGTDRSIFGDRYKTIHDDVNEISAERRNGYSWYNTGPQETLDRYAAWSAAHPPAQAPIPIKVVVVTMFERGEDLGDTPGEFQLWVEREHLDRVLPLAAGYHHLRLNQDGVLGLLTGVGTAKAAASVMALGTDPRFDLTKAYWLVAGIGGGDPADVSLGSAVWADHVIDGDIAYEIDARDIPRGWPTGYVPLRKSRPYEQPVRGELEGERYTLNPALVAWAWRLTKDVPLPDTPAIRTARARFAGFPNALKPPFVTRGDTISGSTFWHGARMDAWANSWARYFTGGNYMIAAMEDTGTMQALTFLGNAGRVDLQRVLVLRTVSNYDREAPGSTAAGSLRSLVSGSYSAYLPALDAAQTVGGRVVRYLVEHWTECAESIPH